MSDHILLAYEFDGKGGGKNLTGKDISKRLKETDLAWVHLDANHGNTAQWLKDELPYLDPFIIEALLIDETRPRMVQINNGALIILRGVNLNDGANPEDMVSIRLWIDQNRIISVRRRKLKSISKLEEEIKQGIGPKDSGGFICSLLSLMFAPIEDVLASLDDETDSIEEMILDSEDMNLRHDIINVRKQAIMFRRYLSPQRDALNQLFLSDLTWLDKAAKRTVQEKQNRVIRYVEDLDAIRERAQIVKDELANIFAEKLNKNMYILSIIAAIFLPLGFLTGLLGVNVGGIPGGEDSSAFYIFCGVLFGVILIQLYIFRKFKWF